MDRRLFGAGVAGIAAALISDTEKKKKKYDTGASDKEIAVALGLSTYTASQYVREILRLHGVSSRQQLMAKLYAGSVHASVGGVGVTPRARVGS